MSRKLTSNERIGLLLTGILIILACIATAVIPRRGAQPVSEIPKIIQTRDSIQEKKKPSTPSTHPTPKNRNPLNEPF
ncbi:MAG: hypothetical protein E7082_04475 [Bacteroidales bacterium]|nr:hypothetical protein [Bacteroidales bacterium]